jgi:uncharacterized tellurite resistance protein B-like protein
MSNYTKPDRAHHSQTSSLIASVKNLKPSQTLYAPEEILLATAVVLLEIASLDDRIDKFEISLIQAGLGSLFSTSPEEIAHIIQQAKNHLGNLRGSSAEIQVLKDSLDPISRREVLKLVHDLTHLHGAPEGFEIYLKNRVQQALGG